MIKLKDFIITERQASGGARGNLQIFHNKFGLGKPKSWEKLFNSIPELVKDAFGDSNLSDYEQKSKYYHEVMGSVDMYWLALSLKQGDDSGVARQWPRVQKLIQTTYKKMNNDKMKNMKSLISLGNNLEKRK